ncbi:MAG TPA: asparagine synthase (glutamine-hydrolyzing) [Candidatus Brocadiaceae bacterium]
MCGIAGIFYKKDLPLSTIKRNLDLFKQVLVHRGPDDCGEYIAERFGVAHLRLSIVDIKGGHQPIFNGDKSIGIVYNGEVYNYKELREELKEKKHNFYTNTDTEVILKAYEEYGTESFSKLKGMFAFCIWDNQEKITYLVRDHFGIKPLYIYNDDKQIIFSSELKGLLAVPDLDLSLDPIGFQDYLTFRYIQAPYTFFRKIRRLEAGTYLKIKDGCAIQFRYWDLSYHDPYPQPELGQVKDNILDKLKKSVNSQLMGEVPVGVMLSGGIDSSTIAYFIHAIGANLKTFNIGFPEVNEFQYSRNVAESLGLEHIEVLITTDDLIQNFAKINFAVDEPIADPACLPLYLLCKEVKNHVTVVLSGEGGDEVFGGYPQYAHVLNSDVSYNTRFRTFLEKSWYFKSSLEFLNNKYVPPSTLRYGKYFEEQPLLNGMLAYDMKTWMSENLMMKADKILMSHSLEGRFPFLDKDLFDYVAYLPQSYKINKKRTMKWLLKEVMSPYLPDSIIKRPKMGFTVPVDLLLSKMKPIVIETINNSSASPLSEVLNIGHMKRLMGNYYQGKSNISALQVWTLFVMVYWFLHSFPKYRHV